MAAYNDKGHFGPEPKFLSVMYAPDLPPGVGTVTMGWCDVPGGMSRMELTSTLDGNHQMIRCFEAEDHGMIRFQHGMKIRRAGGYLNHLQLARLKGVVGAILRCQYVITQLEWSRVGEDRYFVQATLTEAFTCFSSRTECGEQSIETNLWNLHATIPLLPHRMFNKLWDVVRWDHSMVRRY